MPVKSIQIKLHIPRAPEGEVIRKAAALTHVLHNEGDKLLGHYVASSVMWRVAHLASDYLASKVATFEARLPIEMADMSLGWHQERHQVPQAIPEEAELLLYNQP